jgi:acyl-CoA reductase-like NAD-dependent aldehyde dehydrogenase
LKVINPATGESIEEIRTSSREDLDRAAQKARRAFKEWLNPRRPQRDGSTVELPNQQEINCDDSPRASL